MSDKEGIKSEVPLDNTRRVEAYDPAQVAQGVLQVGVKKTRYNELTSIIEV